VSTFICNAAALLTTLAKTTVAVFGAVCVADGVDANPTRASIVVTTFHFRLSLREAEAPLTGITRGAADLHITAHHAAGVDADRALGALIVKLADIASLTALYTLSILANLSRFTLAASQTGARAAACPLHTLVAHRAITHRLALYRLLVGLRNYTAPRVADVALRAITAGVALNVLFTSSIYTAEALFAVTVTDTLRLWLLLNAAPLYTALVVLEPCSAISILYTLRLWLGDWSTETLSTLLPLSTIAICGTTVTLNAGLRLADHRLATLCVLDTTRGGGDTVAAGVTALRFGTVCVN